MFADEFENRFVSSLQEIAVIYIDTHQSAGPQPYVVSGEADDFAPNKSWLGISVTLDMEDAYRWYTNYYGYFVAVFSYIYMGQVMELRLFFYLD